MSKQPRRRKPFKDDPPPLEPIEAAPQALPVKPEPAPKRDRSWDAKRSKATYDLPAELIERIREIAAELGEGGAKVKVSDVARLLIEAGLKQYEAGELKPRPRPASYTLFDD